MKSIQMILLILSQQGLTQDRIFLNMSENVQNYYEK